MRIRKANKEDAKAIARVHVDSWRSTYKGILPDDYLQNLSYMKRTALWENNMKLQDVYVAEIDSGEIVGFTTGGKKHIEKYKAYAGELYAIYILKEYQGKGIGKKLIQSVVDDLLEANINSMIVLVLEDNPSKYFYKRLGAKEMDKVAVKIAGVEVMELVYGWDDLPTTFK